MECHDGCHDPVFEMTVFPLDDVQSADFPMTDRGANAAPSQVPEADKGREIIEACRQVQVMSGQRISTALRLQPVDPE